MILWNFCHLFSSVNTFLHIYSIAVKHSLVMLVRTAVTDFDLQITGSVDAAMEVLIDGIRNVPLCKLLLEVFLFVMEPVL